MTSMSVPVHQSVGIICARFFSALNKRLRTLLCLSAISASVSRSSGSRYAMAPVCRAMDAFSALLTVAVVCLATESALSRTCWHCSCVTPSSSVILSIFSLSDYPLPSSGDSSLTLSSSCCVTALRNSNSIMNCLMNAMSCLPDEASSIILQLSPSSSKTSRISVCSWTKTICCKLA